MGCSSSNEAPLEKVDILAKTPLFTLPRPELQRLAGFFKAKKCVAGSIISQEQEPSNSFYVIAEGQVEFRSKDVTKEDVFLCSKKPGDFFGEEALFQDSARHKATVLAKTAVQLLVLDRVQFERFLDKAPADMKESMSDIIGQGMIGNLEKIHFLQGLSPWKLQLLASLFQYVPVRKDQLIFRQGDSGKHMYVIVQGSVKVSALNEKEEEVEVATLFQGQYFGEIAIMVNMPRIASVRALEDSLLLSLAKEDFENFLKIVPALAERFDLLVKQRTAEAFKKFKVPFFSAIPDDLYRQLAEICEIAQYPKGSVVFAEGEPGSTFYIIVFGKVSVWAHRKADDGKEMQVKLSTMGPGKYFGEVALIKSVTRTATAKAEERCVLLSITQERFAEFFKQHPECFAEFEIKIAQKHCSLKAILNHQVGLDYFTKHLKSEYSEENLNFWKAVRDFRKLQKHDMPTLVSRADAIYKTFIAPDGKEQINIPSNISKAIVSAIKDHKITPQLFNPAADEIEKLLDRDSYKRFKESPNFTEFLNAMQAYHDTETVDPEHVRLDMSSASYTEPDAEEKD